MAKYKTFKKLKIFLELATIRQKMKAWELMQRVATVLSSQSFNHA